MKLNQFKEGDKCIAICYNCKILVDTTFLFKDIPCENERWFVSILVAECAICSKTITIPNQSTKEIKKARMTYYGRKET